jgi:hypothetical protein
VLPNWVQVQVFDGDAPASAPPVWDSGVVNSSTTAVLYGGGALKEAGLFRWRVQAQYAWLGGSSPAPSPWSALSAFGTGVSDWRGAQWIQGGPTLQATLPLPNATCGAEGAGAAVARATVFVSGLGWYQLSVNGSRVGDRELDVGWTRYERRVLYTALDITGAVCPAGSSGSGAAGGLYPSLSVALGGGHFNDNWYQTTAPFVGRLLLLVVSATTASARNSRERRLWRAACGFPGPLARGVVLVVPPLSLSPLSCHRVCVVHVVPCACHTRRWCCFPTARSFGLAAATV